MTHLRPPSASQLRILGLCGFGPVRRAFIIAPAIGDMFVDIIDITNAINITTLINWLACCA
jgi:Na+/glutamate symporter